jgi:glycosyltransferase involved in cell wall biosynthesis
MRVAIVHDWLYTIGGAERVLSEILKCYPEADLFSLFNVLSDDDLARIGSKSVKTSFLQKMPFIKTHHRAYLPLMPFAIEQFDLSGYDLIISSSYAVARGVITGPNQVHICYVHSPMRYAWDLQHFYLRLSGRDKGLKSFFARSVLYHMRMWDVRTAHGPDAMIANSNFVARRIRKIYGRSSTVIYPPVQLAAPGPTKPRGNHFLAASRLVPYKNIDAIVEAFARMPDLTLVVAGEGPELDRLKASAPSNVSFTGWVSDEHLRGLMATARAFVFAAEEDFGIVLVEAQSEGTPVLALGKGGALESVRAEDPAKTGMFFPEATSIEIEKCVRNFTNIEYEFLRIDCENQANIFSSKVFSKKFTAFVEAHIRQAGISRRKAIAPVTRLRHGTMR